MRTRQLRILQMGLAIAAGLLAWRLAAEWQRANLRYSTLSRANTERPAAVLPNPARREPPPAQEIVAKNLFSPDRNNEIAQAVKSEPLPPVPVVFGTMKLGENYEALMAEGGPSPGRSPRRRRAGRGARQWMRARLGQFRRRRRSVAACRRGRISSGPWAASRSCLARRPRRRQR